MYICVCMYVSKWLEPKCPSKAKVWTQPPRPKSFILAILGLVLALLRLILTILALVMAILGLIWSIFGFISDMSTNISIHNSVAKMSSWFSC